MPEVTRRIIAESPGIPALEPINEPLYDTQTYILAGSATLTFFAAGLGVRTLRETNVVIAGALPNPQQFHIYGVQLVPACQGSSTGAAGGAQPMMVDNAAIIDNSFFRLFIGTKNYIEVATVFIPNGHGLTGFGATTVGGRDLFAVTNGVAHRSNYYDVTVKIGRSCKPIHLPPQQNFRAELNFPGTAPVITTNVNIGGAATGGLPLKVFLLGIGSDAAIWN